MRPLRAVVMIAFVLGCSFMLLEKSDMKSAKAWGENSHALAGSSSPAAQAGEAGAQPELKSVKIDFVPGERTIFFDDFSDMAPDEPPPHWKIRDGKVELRVGGTTRELYAAEGVSLTSPSFPIPKDFTFELEWTGGGEMIWRFSDKDNNPLLTALVRGEEDGKTASTTISGPDSDLGSGAIQTDTSLPVKFALWAQQGRVRVYMNGQRLVDVNQVNIGTIDHVWVDDSRYRPNGLRSVRIAESAPDPGTALTSTGKYISHCITFETDSDRLKPESAPVIKAIAAALIKNPNLKLEIDGYTDSVGNAGHNLDLIQAARRGGEVSAGLAIQHRCRPPDRERIRRREAYRLKRHSGRSRPEPSRRIHQDVAGLLSGGRGCGRRTILGLRDSGTSSALSRLVRMVWGSNYFLSNILNGDAVVGALGSP